jgi:hypothetical protein
MQNLTKSDGNPIQIRYKNGQHQDSPTPHGSVNLRITGRNAYVASIGASSHFV